MGERITWGWGLTVTFFCWIKLVFGFLLVDKESGMTSRALVENVAELLRQRGHDVPVGHCGTLDPLATGLMVLALGPATNLTPWLQGSDKQYIAQFQLGVTSESLDTETAILSVPVVETPELAQVRSVCESFRGLIQQTPPKYSAVRVGGKRAYRLARRGKEFSIPPRSVQIYHLEVRSYQWPYLELTIHCGGGTYVRTLGDDVARSLGTRAVMTQLQRTAACHFYLKHAKTLAELRANADWSSLLVSVPDALQSLPHLIVDEQTARRFRNGLITWELDRQLEAIWEASRGGPSSRSSALGDVPGPATEVLLLLEDQRPVGIAYRRPKPGKVDPWRIKLNLAQWMFG